MQTGFRIVFVVLGAFRKLHLFPWRVLKWNYAQYMSDTIQTGNLLVIRVDNAPRRMRRVGSFQHLVPALSYNRPSGSMTRCPSGSASIGVMDRRSEPRSGEPALLC